MKLFYELIYITLYRTLELGEENDFKNEQGKWT